MGRVGRDVRGAAARARGAAKDVLRPAHRAVYRATTTRRKVDDHLETCRREGRPVKVVFGGHWAEVEGWLLLDEKDQDITRPLRLPDASLDVAFTEHVVEHIELYDALRFFRELARVVKPGGRLRCVVPTLEAMNDADLSTPEARSYMGNTIGHAFGREELLVRELTGQSLIAVAPRILFVNFMFYGHGHRFIWTADLLADALRWCGFTTAEPCPIGVGAVPEDCLERRRRGAYLGSDPVEDRSPGSTFNVDSSLVEAIR